MKSIIALFLALAVLPAQAAPDWQQALQGEQRSAENKARDQWRHPRETLEFFGLQEGMTVLEISPGGGWYTEVLAPLVVPQGTLYAAHYAMNGKRAYYRNSLGKYLQKLATDEALYQPIIVTQLQPPVATQAAPAGSADMALAFRNVHSWMRGGHESAVLAAIYAALKPGGVFGVVQHRAKPGTSVEQMKSSGYVTAEHTIAMIEDAGFKLVAQSELNANPRDTADHPKGVWTLPPVLRLGEEDRDKYLAIGESDRMTLKFIKPGK